MERFATIRRKHIATVIALTLLAVALVYAAATWDLSCEVRDGFEKARYGTFLGVTILMCAAAVYAVAAYTTWEIKRYVCRKKFPPQVALN